MILHGPITIDYLLCHGFRQYFNEEDGDVYEVPFLNENYLHFREIEFHRQLFVVTLLQQEWSVGTSRWLNRSA